MYKFSKATILLIIIFLVSIRFYYVKWETPEKINLLTWDAFGYYLYLPGLFIYHDIKKMEWVESIQEKYHTTGSLYQVSKLPNGNRVLKYLGGIAILYSPFFLTGHICAGWLSYSQDGFSPPYQLAICFAALFYAFLGLLILRWVLVHYFSDQVTALTLLLLVLATNYPQYVSVDSGMTHGFIFTLYALLLAVTILWHERPTFFKALLIGCIIGLGIISRPTEGVMIFIPLFFGTQDSASKREKWALVRKHRFHIAIALLGAIVIMFPQFLYWKFVSGKWVYDVGSKWTFLQPHWKVLFGWEKGWFIYTPVAFLMVLGLFYFRKNAFYRSILIYFIINVWIIMAWSDWRYGASYSCRAIVQSYAVMALPLAMVIKKTFANHWKYFILPSSLFLITLNVFQIWQYNKGILHYNDMNRRYYQAIFLNLHPTPLQMSLLDTKDYLKNEYYYTLIKEITVDSQIMLNVKSNPKVILYEGDLSQIINNDAKQELWLQITAQVLSSWGAFETTLSTRVVYQNESKETSCRMQNGLSKNLEWNTIDYYFKVPSTLHNGELSVFAVTKIEQDIFVKDLSVKFLLKNSE